MRGGRTLALPLTFRGRPRLDTYIGRSCGPQGKGRMIGGTQQCGCCLPFNRPAGMAKVNTVHTYTGRAGRVDRRGVLMSQAWIDWVRSGRASGKRRERPGGACASHALAEQQEVQATHWRGIHCSSYTIFPQRSMYNMYLLEREIQGRSGFDFGSLDLAVNER